MQRPFDSARLIAQIEAQHDHIGQRVDEERELALRVRRAAPSEERQSFAEPRQMRLMAVEEDGGDAAIAQRLQTTEN